MDGSWKEDAVLFFPWCWARAVTEAGLPCNWGTKPTAGRCVQEDCIQRHPTSTERQQE